MARLGLGAKVLIVLFAVSATIANFAQAGNGKPKTPKLTPFEYACENLKAQGYDQIKCWRVKEPIIVVSRVVMEVDPSLLGFHFLGEPYVFVDWYLTKDEQDMVAAHETAHYILYEVYGEAVGRCQSEEAARHVGNDWAGITYTDEWKVRYGCGAK